MTSKASLIIITFFKDLKSLYNRVTSKASFLGDFWVRLWIYFPPLFIFILFILETKHHKNIQDRKTKRKLQKIKRNYKKGQINYWKLRKDKTSLHLYWTTEKIKLQKTKRKLQNKHNLTQSDIILLHGSYRVTQFPRQPWKCTKKNTTMVDNKNKLNNNT